MRAPAARSGTTRGTSQGGDHIGNRGVGVYGNWLYFETPDCNLVSLNLKDGKERWHKPICDLDQYLLRLDGAAGRQEPHHHRRQRRRSRPSPATSNRTIRRPATLQWRWYAYRRRRAIPEPRAWPSVEAMQHGGGMTWLTRTYDPELNLIYVGTGNPQPVIAGQGAARATNLYTASIVALNPDTGKMPWYFQPSPHDTHDWDATQTPVLIDGEINGQKRKLVAQASRNGYFFVLDRATGKNIITSEFVKTNWAKGVDENGSADPESGQGAAARRRARDAEPGRRRQLAAAELTIPTPACSTSAPRARSASSTSTTRATSPKAGAATIAAAGASR